MTEIDTSYRGIDDPRHPVSGQCDILVFPNANNRPTSRAQLLVGVSIPLSIFVYLLAPPFSIGFRPGHVARAAMPEASIHENRHSGGPEDDVCLSSQSR
jgi:hypothetical protein